MCLGTFWSAPYIREDEPNISARAHTIADPRDCIRIATQVAESKNPALRRFYHLISIPLEHHLSQPRRMAL